ncbi:hypothetical protein GCM10027277_06770 [Pseudoduganella ginsengisoli]|uniref:Uncharacterized protein n=1 Tax=Pseudoduganella ginsengisoli TaxID=1462440 RepID=A0A6L6Q6F4_9BURK|nr:hypothetical protein [Pseudoduganella ginsengisoli]MTW05260.1 hypothetical protein [Pseudoduganella ginsengisoli]
MNTTSLPHQKTLRFAIETEAALSTLENALAIIRRTGITLDGMRIAPGADGMDVWMRLGAEEDDALTLCRMRLHNVVGILAIREFPRPAAMETAAQLAAA